ncbi:MAG TPA: hypothetical protein VFE62_20190 [Gemmataceae bacterium]|nr:hypothetical protein [Gemmataceae bacterium]
MRTLSRYSWLIVCCASLLAGCELFPHFGGAKNEKVEKEPLPGAPGKYNIRVSQFIFFHDVPINANLPIFKDLSNLREQVYRDLRLPPSDTLISVYLFEDKARYEKFMHAKHPELPDRRAFFVAQARRMGGVEELMVYTYLGDRIHQDLRHELTHAILHSTLKNVPIWLDEGLAEYFEIPTVQNGFNAAHLDQLRKPAVRLDLERLERLELVNQMTPAEYRESWAWVHLMLRTSPQAKQALLSYLQDLRTNPNPGPLRPRLATAFASPEGALQSHLAELERRVPRGATAKR